ncbi:hypothetical protein [Paenibacillus montanisoli]|uniref:Uncharacterized protein n=1 Tax=Paenibacillus montanisoli TaxID=2081970 RepID=A0A328TXE9_9BACL|nr:hypothetical protein [Paenibacillus montanisoli]RAP75110.1 hypothetical protein DL346_17130 [Paenibacillus montanisoli]
MMQFSRITLVWIGLLTCMTVLAGCAKTDNHPESPVVKKEQTVEIAGLTNEIRKVTSSQLSQITKDMTYKEVIDEWGNSKDIGSGRYIFRYEIENGEYLELNFGHFDEVLSDESYQSIQNLLNG